MKRLLQTWAIGWEVRTGRELSPLRTLVPKPAFLQTLTKHPRQWSRTHLHDDRLQCRRHSEFLHDCSSCRWEGRGQAEGRGGGEGGPSLICPRRGLKFCGLSDGSQAFRHACQGGGANTEHLQMDGNSSERKMPPSPMVAESCN